MYRDDLGHEPEGDPTDRACPRCHTALHDMPESKEAVFACPGTECGYVEEADPVETWGLLRTMQVRATKLLWPHPWLGGIWAGAIVALALLTILGTGPYALAVVGGVVAVLASSLISPHEYCSQCGYESLADTEGFCGNCGISLSETVTTVDPDADGYYTRTQTWVNSRLPAGVEWRGVINIDITSGQDRTHLLDRLLVGPRSWWARFFDVGIVVATVLQLVAIVATVVGIHRAIGDLASASDGSTGEAEALSLPAVDLIVAAVVLLAVVGAISLAVHELGHALAARFADTPVSELNLCFIFGIIASSGYVRALDGNASPRADARTTAAGPFFSVLLAAVGLVAYIAVSGTVPWAWDGAIGESATELLTLSTLALSLFVFNICVAAVNLLPIAHTDGRLLNRAFLRWITAYRERRKPDSSTEPAPTDTRPTEDD